VEVGEASSPVRLVLALRSVPLVEMGVVARVGLESDGFEVYEEERRHIVPQIGLIRVFGFDGVSLAERSQAHDVERWNHLHIPVARKTSVVDVLVGV
jgi:hypothetical protein